MDKLQPVLAFVKKQYFWLLCLSILIASTVVWMMAVGNVQTEARQNLQRIQSSKQDAMQVSNVSQHPNDQIVAAYNQQTEALKKQVFQVWDDLYKKQRASVLQWPPALGENFIKHVESIPFLADIPVDLRDLYFNYVKTRWAELPAIIKARPLAVEAKPGVPSPTATGGAGQRKATPDHIVVWDDQERIRKQLFSNERPSSDWVWLTQEDLWIYENLLNIIKEVNQEAIGPHNAIISTIISMDVGKSAASDAGGTGRRISTGGAEDSGDSDSRGSSGGGGGLLNGRYIDSAGSPLQNGQQAREDEYKRIPVRMVLRMDSTEIPRMILSCANADLPVEIQQVRINVGSDGNRNSSVRGPDLNAEDRAAGRKRPHVEVSLHGMIYIFNPPNKDKLKLPKTGSEVSSSTAAFGEEAEATTPPTTTSPAFEDDAAAGDAPATPAPGEAPADAGPGEAAPTAEPTAPTEAAPAEAAPAQATPAASPPSGDLEDLFKE